MVLFTKYHAQVISVATVVAAICGAVIGKITWSEAAIAIMAALSSSPIKALQQGKP